MEGFSVHVSTNGLDKLKAVLRMFPQETQKAVAQYLNDSARLFKDLAPKVLGEKYTIRNKGFVNKQFKVKKANTGDKIENQTAQAYTEAYERFSGWEEELTGGPRPQRANGEGRYHRLIWNTARGGDPQAQVKGQYRLRAGGAGYNSDILPDSRQYGMPIPQFLAMLSKSPKDKEGNKRIGRNKVFILGGPGWPLGLYTFKNTDGYEGLKGTSMPEVVALQQFKETPIRAKKFDWRQIVEDKVRFWFSPDKVWDTYFAPIVEKLWKK
jgi:hypothetical protein